MRKIAIINAVLILSELIAFKRLQDHGEFNRGIFKMRIGRKPLWCK